MLLVFVYRICIKNVYYNAAKEKIYLDFVCKLEYINEHDCEFLYIRNDNEQQYTW